MAATVEQGLWDKFEAFCSFGEREAEAALDSFHWTKLVRDAGILSREFGSNNSDIVFSKVCPRGQRKMSFDDFIVALGLIAEMKYPVDPQGFAKVVTDVLKCSGPMVTGTSPIKNKEGSIFAKLTDPNLYTGTHVYRFDDSGRGLGLAGRDSIAHGRGTHHVWHEGEPVRDLSDMLRPGMRGGTHISSEQARRRRERVPVVSPSYSPRRAPPSSSHYASGGGGGPGSPAHFAAHAGSSASSASPRYDGHGGGSPRPATAAAASSPRLRVAANPSDLGGGGGGGDGGPRDLSALGSIFAAYCLFGGSAASSTGDEMTSAAFAKLCREAGITGGGPGRVPPPSVDVAFSKARGPARKRLGYDGFLFALQLLAIECYPGDAEADPLGVTARLAARVVAAGGPGLNVSGPVAEVVAASALGSPTAGMPRIFAKLTDHRLFTGSHTHRFDAATGAGRGRAGREYIPGVDDDDSE